MRRACWVAMAVLAAALPVGVRAAKAVAQADAPDPGPEAYRFLLVWIEQEGFDVTIDFDGERYAEFASDNPSMDPPALPLRDGLNRLVIELARRAPPAAENDVMPRRLGSHGDGMPSREDVPNDDQDGEEGEEEDEAPGIWVYLSPSRDFESEHLVCGRALWADTARARVEVTVESLRSRPGQATVAVDQWYDLARTKPLQRHRGRGEALAEDYAESAYQDWYPNGVQGVHEVGRDGRVVTGVYRDPRGEGEVEVRDGQGLQRYWSADGQLTGEYPVRDGLNEGPFREWHDNGQVLAEGTYRAGKLEGPHVRYDEDGQVERRLVYRDGKVTGLAMFYGPSGRVEEESHYIDGELHGLCRLYDEEGRLSAERVYDHGQLTGPLKRYHPNGRLLSEGTCRDGLYEGTYREYHENGRLAEEGRYEADEPDGRWSYYLDDGRLSYRVPYREGEIVRRPPRPVRSPDRGFRLTLPEGFEPFPGGKWRREVIFSWVRPERDQPPLRIRVLAPGRRLPSVADADRDDWKAGQARKLLEAACDLALRDDVDDAMAFRDAEACGTRIGVVECREHDDETDSDMRYHYAFLPLAEGNLILMVDSEDTEQARIRATMDEVLAGLEAKMDWPAGSPGSVCLRLAVMGATVVGVLVLVLIGAGSLVLAIRRRRRRAPASAEARKEYPMLPPDLR